MQRNGCEREGEFATLSSVSFLVQNAARLSRNFFAFSLRGRNILASFFQECFKSTVFCRHVSAVEQFVLGAARKFRQEIAGIFASKVHVVHLPRVADECYAGGDAKNFGMSKIFIVACSCTRLPKVK